MEKISSGKSNKRFYITENSQETQHLAEDFSQRLILDKGSTLTHARVLALYGELGSGKTTFVQGLAKGLDVTKRIISPTFVIVRYYNSRLTPYSSSESDVTSDESRSSRPVRQSQGRQARTIHFYHVDLYRIESRQDLAGLGVEEILSNPQNIVVIEWAERMGDMLPKKRIDIQFEHIREEERKITISNIK